MVGLNAAKWIFSRRPCVARLPDTMTRTRTTLDWLAELDLGAWILGIGSFVFGLACLLQRDFAIYWQPVPAGVPFREALAFASAVLNMVSGLALLDRVAGRGLVGHARIRFCARSGAGRVSGACLARGGRGVAACACARGCFATSSRCGSGSAWRAVARCRRRCQPAEPGEPPHRAQRCFEPRHVRRSSVAGERRLRPFRDEHEGEIRVTRG